MNIDGKFVTVQYEFGIKIVGHDEKFIPLGTIGLEEGTDTNDPDTLKSILELTEGMVKELVGKTIIPTIRPLLEAEL